MKPDQLDAYFKENRNYMADEKAFYYYMRAVLDEKNIKLKDVYLQKQKNQAYSTNSKYKYLMKKMELHLNQMNLAKY